jgi:hypothetical protein
MARESRKERTIEPIQPKPSGFRKKSMVEGKSEDPLTALKALAPMSDTLAAMLGIPPDIHQRAASSFSTDSAKGIEMVPESLFLGLEFPNDIPDYGIVIHSRGSSIFCTLLDKKRKIIVSEAVGNLHSSGGGNWSSFQSSLQSAIARSKALQDEGRKFSFVVEAEVSSIIE